MFAAVVRNIYLLLSLCATAKAAYGTCINPHQVKGICVQIRECNYLINVLTSNLTEESRTFLTNSQCGRDTSKHFAEEKILVCCPEEFSNRRRTNGTGQTPGNLLPEPGKCGKAWSNKIIGGNKTGINEFPWMALIQYKTGPDEFGFHCGGSLINARYVLTAAHCLKHPSLPPRWELYAVRLGEWDLVQDPDCIFDSHGLKDCVEPYMDILIDYGIAHPGYIPESNDQFNDIALIRLVDSVPTTSGYIIPICLPLTNKPRTSNVMQVAGWGATESGLSSKVKLKITINEWNIKQCQNLYREYGKAINSHYQLCAGGEKGVDACSGDSGGPLMAMQRLNGRNRYVAIGIVSYGPTPCGLKGYPGVYTRVDSYMDWIIDNLLP
ncbi:serine protease ea-like isoform X2 [Musca autumnalis]|uniref:serine protease ea-like isoform X2 n=1 Tax=Musca autumnalis TaxID=221902 RepID=UPI003CEADA81